VEEIVYKPQLADDLTLKTPTLRAVQRAKVVAHGFTPSGGQTIAEVSRFKEGLRIEQVAQPNRKLDLHYCQVYSVQFEGHQIHTENRSVVGRAIVGKIVAGHTGAMVGALSGLQKDSTTSTWFSITYWDVKTESWKKQLLETIDYGVMLMECAAEDLQAFEDGTDPDQLHDPTKWERTTMKVLGYGVVVLVGLVVLYNAVSIIVRDASSMKATPTVFSASSVGTVAADPVPPAFNQAEDMATTQLASKAETTPASIDLGAAVQVVSSGDEMQPPMLTAKVEEPTRPSFDCAEAKSFHEQ
jgi:hypothetical protein